MVKDLIVRGLALLKEETKLAVPEGGRWKVSGIKNK